MIKKIDMLKPTNSELEILQILWAKGPISVRKVNDLLNETKTVGYTTTLKIMQIMTEKGICVRDTSHRSHMYSAALTESNVKGNLLDSFLEKTFKGSASGLMMALLGNNKTSADELDKIKDLINSLEKNTKG